MLKNSSGFTLLELMVVVSIVAILAAIMPGGLARLTGERRSEQEVLGFWMEMRGLRSKVMRNDVQSIVKFDISANSYTMFSDTNDNLLADNFEIIRSTFPAQLEFGIADPAPSILPPGVADISIVSGGWTLQGLRVLNDATLSIPVGHIYIKNTNANNKGYCLFVKDGSSEVKLYKWSGSQWYEM